MIAKNILANYENDDDYNSWIKELNNEALNYESPFAVAQDTTIGQKSALDMSNAYMALKQRKQMVMEYYSKNSSSGDIETKSITMYVNPEKMQISYQKEIAAVKTRGGVFYHHWGNNNPTMVLSGSTGMSGMAGIKKIEDVYLASGTLLRYNNYGINQVYGSVSDYTQLDYSDPVSVVQTVTNSDYDSSKIDDIKDYLNEYASNKLNDTDEVSNSINYLNTYQNNSKLQNFINNDLSDIYDEVQQWDDDSNIYYRKYFQKILSKLNNILPNMDSDIKVNIAYELSLKKLYSNLSSDDSDSAISDSDTNTLTAMVNLETARQTALSNYLSELQDYKQREQSIRSILKGGFVTLTDELKDEWLPRKIIIYYENRAYIGHFDSFNYNQDAQTNLITYDLRFTIEYQYEFSNSDDTSDSSSSVSISSNSSSSSSTNTVTSKTKYVVQSGDTTDSIAQKFYGDASYWPEVYAANMDTMNYATSVYIGEELTIKPLSKKYYNWVVLEDGETLYYVVKRFYGSYDRYAEVWELNKDVIGDNPDFLHSRTILKIPK